MKRTVDAMIREVPGLYHRGLYRLLQGLPLFCYEGWKRKKHLEIPLTEMEKTKKGDFRDEEVILNSVFFFFFNPYSTGV
jgi:hypothetical protein